MNAEKAATGDIPFWRPGPGALPEGVWFGMTTRTGGVSSGPYVSFNLGLRVGDDESAVRENRRRLRAAIGMSESEPRLLHQVHGRTIVEPAHALEQADGFLSRAGDPWVAISAADCAPVALAAEDAGRAAVLHSGWRGARERIAAHAVELLAESGAPASSIRAVIGPCLHSCCFPIGPEVAREFDARFLRPHPSGQASLDLPLAIAAAMMEAGVDGSRIETAPECTSCRSDLFYSHRRDRGLTGRHWALLRVSPRPPR